MKVIQKFFLFLGVILGVSTILFILFRWILDPTQMLVGQRMDSETLKNIQEELGLNLPLHQQYMLYLNDLSPIGLLNKHHQGLKIIGNIGIKFPYLGFSLYYKEFVWKLFLQHIGATFLLATISVLLAFISAYLIGKYLYLKNQISYFRWSVKITNIFIATPSFILSILLLYIFSLQWNLLPISGYFIQKDIFTLQNYWDLSYLILPVLASSIRPFSIFLQMILQLLKEEDQKDYVRTAKAKGLLNHQLYENHIFPNILPTLISLFFNWWGNLLSGAFFIEYIFDYPGIGKLLVESILQNDYPMVSGLCLITAILFILINTMNELLLIKFRKN
jgi:peptide/nickel transport system permease protein